MRQLRLKTLTVLVAVLVLGLLVGISVAACGAESEALRQDLDKLSGDVASLTAAVNQEKESVTALQVKLADDVGNLTSQVAAVKESAATKESLASVEQAAQSLQATATALQSQLLALAQQSFTVAYNDPNFDANTAKDSTGQQGTLTVKRIGTGKIDISLSALRLPPSRTYYLYIQTTKVGATDPPVLAKAGDVVVGDNGRGALTVALARAPGTYTIGGFLTNEDKGPGPYTNRIYLCLPSVAALVQ